ncbi:DUF5602 domain-containing protein [Pontibacter vulgaris]|uniref:DUF5602 domain-containing protein n=1 Tax=Pontibacter vulgaris TaxID=2905679 RepID=UPI001FA7B7B8|nr:DUF5602 domain-containing protein [Pontibacter vulgaris]
MKTRETLTLKNGALYLLLMFVFCISACEPQEEMAPGALKAGTANHAKYKKEKTSIHYGPATPLGKGVARAWVEVTHDGEPLAIGVNISAKAAASLPNKSMMFDLQLPKQAGETQYTSVGLDWNPDGHLPMQYLLPHFDVHFYMIADEERMMIPHELNHEFTLEFKSNYMPELYVSTAESISAMGVHWADVLSPELSQGATFTKTLILGAYNNRFIFIEPMVTLNYLQQLTANQPVVSSIRQAPKVQVSGYYPLTYTMLYDATPGEYEISLTDLRYRSAQ